MTNDLLQEIGIPPCHFSCAFDSMFWLAILDQGMRQLSQSGEILGAVPDPQLVCILTEYYIENPVKLVFDFPVIAHTLQQFACRQYPTGDEIPRFHFDLIVYDPLADDDANGFQALPQPLVPNLGEVRADVA